MQTISKERYGLWHILACISRGQSLTRIFMNRSLSRHTLRGRVVDVGGGHRPDYFKYFKLEEPSIKIEALDGSFSGIDFECDMLPFPDGTVDTVILCNVLEHVYRYAFLLSEIHRILKNSGYIIGFVPFWVGYHPDPRDYFRYTNECLERILSDAGFKQIRIQRIGGGPIIANFNTIMLSLPQILRPLVYLLYAGADFIFTRLRPKSVERNPLGYVFTAYRGFAQKVQSEKLLTSH